MIKTRKTRSGDRVDEMHTLVDVGRVSLLSGGLALLLVSWRGGGLLASLLLLGRSLSSGGLAGGARRLLLSSSFGRHFG